MIRFEVSIFLIITFFIFKSKELLAQPKIVFNRTEIDFGEIKEGEIKRVRFLFKNEGTAELKIQRVRASCGCTTPEWYRKEILAGDTSSISVEFNSFKRTGYITKTIVLSSNSQPPQTYLLIKGKVLEFHSNQSIDENQQSSVENEKPSIKKATELISETDSLDLGKIERGQKIYYHINLINQGPNPVKIIKIKNNSSLISWELEKNQIKSGQNSGLKILFDSGVIPLEFSDDLSIFYKGFMDSEIKIKIRAQIVESILEQNMLKTDKRMGF